MGFRSPQEAVKIIGDSLHGAVVTWKNQNTLNQDAPVAIAKGNTITRGKMPEMNALSLEKSVKRA
jgi:DNA mismatch repair protein MutS